MSFALQDLIPYRHDGIIQKSADEFRSENWGNSIPVDIELIAERNMNLLVIPIDGLMPTCGTDAMLLGNLEEINYDPQSPPNRVRYTIAHEIGHLVLHKAAISKLRPESYEDWVKIIESVPKTICGRAEYQAYEFAGRLLVPPDKLKEAINKLKPLIEVAKKELPYIEPEVLIDFLTPSLARIFDVSADVIKRRIKIEKIKI